MAMIIALLAIGASAPVVLAECPPGPDDHRLDVGYALTATVTEASADVGPAVPGNTPFDWHLEIAIEREYRGDIPKRLAFDGWDAGCSPILGQRMRSGDRVFILSEHFELDPMHRNPLGGDFLMWRRERAGWAFYAEALGACVDDRWLTLAIRNTTSTNEILRLIKLHPPDTATDPRPREPGWPALVAVFALSLVVAGSRFRALRTRS